MTDAEKSQAIKRHLAVLGLKQKDVADILGVTRVTVSNLINQPRFGKKTAYAWHSAFGFSVDFLVNGTGPVLSSDAVREPGSITQNITGNSGIAVQQTGGTTNAATGKDARCVSLYLSALAHIVGSARLEHNDPEHGIRLVGDPFAHFAMPHQQQARRRNVPPALVALMLYWRGQLAGRERLGVDVFLISFALMGMNAPDLYEAKAAQGGVITYERAKTRDRRSDRALMRVRVEPCVASLLAEYAGRDGWMFSFRERYARTENFSRAVNLGLAEFSARLGLRLPCGLTLYCARHTWGTVARSAMCRVDKGIVHEALCHVDSSMRVTDIYADKDWPMIWAANARVLRLFPFGELV